MTGAKLGTGRKLPRMLVVRVGWMTYYAGSTPGDEQPVRGGAYNYENIGLELFNFLDLDGNLHGYSQPAGDTFNLQRIDPLTKGSCLEKVLVVFIATHPNGGQHVVGWYRNARVYHLIQKETDIRRSLDGNYFGYYFQVPATAAVLLPLNERTLVIQTGADTMGRHNVFYPYEGDGTQRNLLWLEQVVDFIVKYDGENLLPVVKGGPEEAAVKGAELAKGTTAGQGFLRAAAIRQAVEHRAMNVAEEYYRQRGWHIDNHSANRPYDLLGTKDGVRLYIEVKGTQGDGNTIFLTPREVECARKHHPQTVLVVVTGIKVSLDKDPIEAQDGELHIIQPWCPDDALLTPLAYQFKTGLGVSS
jgi:hypothetical protein